jgi:amidase
MLTTALERGSIVSDVCYWSATRMADSIRKKETSSEEIVRACIQRIEEVNPIVNAVVQSDFDNAISRAKQADEAIKNNDIWGPIHGVPVTIKDSIEVSGIISAGGTMGRKDFIPEQDATLVNRLKEAGAIVLGTTNVPELCLAFEADNLVYGKTNNPYNTSLSSGGSSGGEAAIIASGGSPLGLGSDAGGSVRVPAHFCGIAGIKPTSGRLPRTGHFIPPGGAIDSLWQIGPMARSVDDLITVFPFLLGVDYQDVAIVPMPYHDPNEVKLETLRVGYYTDNQFVTPTKETVDTVTKCVNDLSAQGVTVEEVQLPNVDWVPDFWIDLLAADGGALVKHVFELCGTTEYHPLMQRLFEFCQRRAKTTAEFIAMFIRWDQFRAEMLNIIKDYDVLISPACAYTAAEHGTTYNNDVFCGFSYTIVYNLTGWPGTVVRCGTSNEGMPIGVQAVSKPWREDISLAVARYLEKQFSGWVKPEL